MVGMRSSCRSFVNKRRSVTWDYIHHVNIVVKDPSVTSNRHVTAHHSNTKKHINEIMTCAKAISFVVYMVEI